MTEQLVPPVAPDQLRITVEVGADHQLSPEVDAALQALADALQGTEAEVAGFSMPSPVRSFSYDSLGFGQGGRADAFKIEIEGFKVEIDGVKGTGASPSGN